MRPLPTPPAPGKPVSATLIRQLIDAIRERTILPGRNTSVTRGKNGTVVNAAASAAAAAAAVPSLLHPWKVFAVGKSEDVDHFFEIYIPNATFNESTGEFNISFGFVAATGIGFNPVEGKVHRYTVEAEDDLSEGEYFLNLFVYTVESESEDEDDDGLEVKCTVSTMDVDEFRAQEEVVDVVFYTEIAWVSIESRSGQPDAGKVAENPLTYHPYIPAPLYT